MSDSTIDNPFPWRGLASLPAGTIVRTTHPRKGPRYILRRRQTVKVFALSVGYVDTMNYFNRGFGYIILPTITWPGTGGYWCDAQVTPEVLVRNNLMVPKVPGEDGMIGYTKLDYIPDYYGNNTDRWKA